MLTDPALRGLDGREKGSPCTTACAPDCAYTCHERHKPDAEAAHDQYYCDQIRLGRDVSRLERRDRTRPQGVAARP